MSLEDVDRILNSPEKGASDLEVIETLATVYESIANDLGVACVQGLFNYNYPVHQAVSRLLTDRKVLPDSEREFVAS
jgi:hypothetical protein